MTDYRINYRTNIRGDGIGGNADVISRGVIDLTGFGVYSVSIRDGNAFFDAFSTAGRSFSYSRGTLVLRFADDAGVSHSVTIYGFNTGANSRYIIRTSTDEGGEGDLLVSQIARSLVGQSLSNVGDYGIDLDGGAGSDILIGGSAGGDTLDGHAGYDTASFARSSGGITFDATSTATNGFRPVTVAGSGKNNKIKSIEKLIGSAHGDTFTLGVNDGIRNRFEGAAGDDEFTIKFDSGSSSPYFEDILIGGRGSDTLALAGENNAGALVVNLLRNTMTIKIGDARPITQTISSFENLDLVSNSYINAQGLTFIGSNADNILKVGNLLDVVVSINALGGRDTLDLSGWGYVRGVNINQLSRGRELAGDDLKAYQMIGNDFTTSIRGFEKIIGTDRPDYIYTSLGNDEVHGGDEDDFISVGKGNDVVDGGKGVDTIDYSLDRGSRDGVAINLEDGSFRRIYNSRERDTITSIENIIGTNARDILTGDSAANKLEGGGGNDDIDGAGGNDILIGGGGDDTFLNLGTPTGGVDTVSGGDGFDTVDFSGVVKTGNTLGSVVNNVAVPGDAMGIGILRTSTGIKVFRIDSRGVTVGEAGSNIIATLQGIEKIIGTNYFDRINADAEGSELIGGGGKDSLTGSSGNDKLYGGEGWDALYGRDGNDELYGGEGDDRLEGDAGNDKLYGGDGNDDLVSGSGTNRLEGGAGFDEYLISKGSTNRIIDSDARTHARNTKIHLTDLRPDGDSSTLSDSYGSTDGERLLFLLDQGFSFRRIRYDLEIKFVDNSNLETKTTISNFYRSADKYDFIFRTASNENAKVSGEGFTQLRQKVDGAVPEGVDEKHLAGSNVNDILTGRDNTAAADIDNIYGFGGRDILSGLGGVDNLYGGDGDDTLDGGAGADTLEGGAGNDRIVGGAGGDTIDGGDGNDILEGDAGVDTLKGGAGDDRITGGADGDAIDGGDGVDTISYEDSTAGVTYDFTAASQVGVGGDAAGDSISNVERIIGSANDDTFTLSTETGGLNDIRYIDAGAGKDTLVLQGVESSGIRSLTIDLARSRLTLVDADGARHYVSIRGFEDVELTDAAYFGKWAVIGNNAANKVTLKGLISDTDIVAGDPVVPRTTGQLDGRVYLGGGNDELVIDSKLSWAFNPLEDGETRLNLDVHGGGGKDKINFAGEMATVHGGSEFFIVDLSKTGLQRGRDSGRIEVAEENFLGGSAWRVRGIEDLDIAAGIYGTFIGNSGVANEFTSLQNEESGGGAPFVHKFVTKGGPRDTYILDAASGSSNNGAATVEIDATAAFTIEGRYKDSGRNNLDISFADARRGINIDFTNEEFFPARSDLLIEQITGSRFADRIVVGSHRENYVSAGAGNDRIYIGNEDSSYAFIGNVDGEDGNDIIETLTRIHALSGDDDPNLVLKGGKGDDRFIIGKVRGDAIHTVDGGDGIDTIDYSKGLELRVTTSSSTERFTEGHDEGPARNGHGVSIMLNSKHESIGASVRSIKDGVVFNSNAGNIQEAVVKNMTGIENAIGTKVADSITGDGGNNRLEGLGGDDILAGGAGADRLYGGDGDDTLTGGSSLITTTDDSAEPPVTTTQTNIGGGSYFLNSAGTAPAFGKIANAQKNILQGGKGEDTYIISENSINEITDRDDGTIIDFSEAGVIGLGGNADNEKLLVRYLLSDAASSFTGRRNGNDLVIILTKTTDRTANSQKESTFSSYLTTDAPYQTITTIKGFYSGGIANAEKFTFKFKGTDRFRATDADPEVVEITGDQFLTALRGSTIDLSETTDPVDGRQVVGTGGSDTIKGSTANNVISGLGGNDKLYGTGGRNVINGGGGVDTVYGGTSNDAIYGYDAVLLEPGRGTRDILHGGGNSDIIYGQKGNDEIYGDAGKDSLFGNEGADTIKGGTGDDTLEGGTGNDKLYGDADDDTIYGGIRASNNIASGNDLLEGGAGRDTLYGGDGDDIIRGGIGDDKLVVLDQPDSVGLDGGAGNDKIYGGAGNDIIAGGTGNDEIYGDADDDIISGGEGNDRIYGGVGADTIRGGDGVDTIRGGEGHDTLLAGDAGDDKIYGDVGNDILEGGVGDDELYGGDGVDTLEGGDGDDLLEGGDDADSLSGQGDDDVLRGGAGDDTLLAGGAGNDELDGGAGDDNLMGGEDEDTFINLGIFSRGALASGVDTIDGGAGIDIADFSKGGTSGDGIKVALTGATAADVTLNDGGTTKVASLKNVERVDGTRYADDIAGDGQNNLIRGLGGNDILSSGTGNDNRLEGGSGADTYKIGAGSTTAVYDRDTRAKSIIDMTNLAALVIDPIAPGGADTRQDFQRFIDTDAVEISRVGYDLQLTITTGEDTAAGNDDVSTFLTVENYYRAVRNYEFMFKVKDDTGGTARPVEIEGIHFSFGRAPTLSLRGTKVEDTLIGDGLRNDNLRGRNSEAYKDTLDGRGGDDVLSGFAGDDTLKGGRGGDRLIGGAGADVLDGEDGIDTADYSGSNAGVAMTLAKVVGANFANVDGGHATGDTIKNIERVIGSKYGDEFKVDAESANAIKYEVIAGSGNDILDVDFGGNSNPNTLSLDLDFDAGRGTDTLILRGDVTQSVGFRSLFLGDNAIRFNGRVGVVNLEGFENVDLTNLKSQSAAGAFRVVGNAAANTITLGGEATVGNVAGGLKEVRVETGAGNDVVKIGDGVIKIKSLDGGSGFDMLDFSGRTEGGVKLDLARNELDGVARDPNTGNFIDDSSKLEQGAGSIINFERVIGSAQDDSLNGGTGVDRLVGGAGNDFLRGRGGSDYLDGGEGSDTVSYQGDATGVTVTLKGARTATFRRDDRSREFDRITNVENIDGSTGDDYLTGDGSANRIVGFGGDDTIRGGGGDDTLVGAAGHDTIYGDAGADIINGVAGDDMIKFSISRSYKHGDGEGVVPTFDIDVVDGGADTDTADFSRSYFQDGRIRYGIQVDLKASEATVAAVSLVKINRAENALQVASLDNIENVYGTGYADVITGGAGANVIKGNGGNDNIAGGDGGDTLYGGSGHDEIDGGGSGDTIYGGSGNDVLRGGSNSGAYDTIYGESGNDEIHGGGGRNTLRGGSGSDTYFITKGSGDTIFDGSGLSTIDLTSVGTFSALSTGTAGTSNLLALLKAGLSFERPDGTANLVLTINDGATPPVETTLTINNFYRGTGNYRFEFKNGATAEDTVTFSGREFNNIFNPQTLRFARNNVDPTATLEGGAGNDVLYGRNDATLTDVLNSGEGNDRIVGSLGIDKIDGGEGIDIADYRTSSEGVKMTLAKAAGVGFKLVSGGQAASDIIKNIEVVWGSNAIRGEGAGDEFTLFARNQVDYTVLGNNGADKFTIDFTSASGDTGGYLGDNLQGGGQVDTLALKGASTLGDISINFLTRSMIIRGTDIAGDSIVAGFEDLDLSGYTSDTSNDGKSLSFVGTSGTNRVTLGGFTTTGNLILDGGRGSDTLDFTGRTAAVTVNLGVADAYGAGNSIVNFEHVVGGTGDDTITGSRANNVLEGGAGVDKLTGGAGNDRLLGGANDDFLKGGSGNDVIDGGAGIDTVSYEGETSGVRITLKDDNAAGNPVNAYFRRGREFDRITNVENIRGSEGNDVLTGDSADNTFTGGGGKDTITGGGGFDTIYGNTNDDIVRFDVVTDIVYVTGKTQLLGTADGGAGEDTLDFSKSYFLEGDTRYGIAVTLTDDWAALKSQGAPTERTIVSVLGFENVLGTNYKDVITGGGGANVIWGNGGDDTLTGAAGHDKLYGGAGDDTLVGEAGDDELYGGDGNDILRGGDGTNRLEGGRGLDIYGIQSGSSDTIFDTGGDIKLRSLTVANVAALVGQGDAFEAKVGRDWTFTFTEGTGTDEKVTTLTIKNFARYYTGYTFEFNNNVIITGKELRDSIVPRNIRTNSDEAIAGSLGANTMTGGAGVQTFDGLSGNDRLYGLGGNDILKGGAGDDILDGGADNDNLAGGTGDDRFLNLGERNSGADIIDGGAGQDVADFSGAGAIVTLADKTRVSAGVTVDLSDIATADAVTGGRGAEIADSYGTLANVEDIVGSRFADEITLKISDAVSNKLSFGDGNDVLMLTDANIVKTDRQDIYDGGRGSDTLDLSAMTSMSSDTSIVKKAITNFIYLKSFDYEPGRPDFFTAKYPREPEKENNIFPEIVRGTRGKDELASEDATGDGVVVADRILIGGGGYDTYTITKAPAYRFTRNEFGGPNAAVSGKNAITHIRDNGGLIDLSGLSGLSDDGVRSFLTSGENILGSLVDGDLILSIKQYNDDNDPDLGFTTSLVIIENYARNARSYNFKLSEEVSYRGDTLLPYVVDGNDGYIIRKGSAGTDRVAILNNFENVIGSAGKDHIFATNAASTIHGGGDNDVIYGDAIAGSVTSIGFDLFGDTINLDQDDNIAGGNDELYGGDGNDIIVGLGGNDVIEGGAGDDKLSGDHGNDIISGGLGEDTIIGGRGNDIISGGGDGSNVLFGNRGDDMFISSTGGKIVKIRNVDVFVGDSISGGTGIDTLSYEHSPEVTDSTGVGTGDGITLDLSGRTTDERYVATGSGGHAKADRVTGIENVIGSEFNDIITGFGSHNSRVGNAGYSIGETPATFPSWYGGGPASKVGGSRGAQEPGDVRNGANRLEGLAGNDELEGMGGNDVLLGGKGDDILNGGSGNDRLDGGEGSDTVSYEDDTTGVIITLRGTANAAFRRAGSREFDRITNVENIKGSQARDILNGDGRNNKLEGLGGNDLIRGGAGADNLLGGDGNDEIYGGAGEDIIYGGEGNDEIYGGAGGLFGNDIFGEGGDDTIKFSSQTISQNLDFALDEVDGGEGIDIADFTGIYFRLAGKNYGIKVDLTHSVDTVDNAGVVTENIASVRLNGETENKQVAFVDNIEGVYGTNYADAIIGGTEANVFRGNGGDDVINGGGGLDKIYGGSGDDIINGDNGWDVIYGDDGKDTIDGGTGDDTLYGGSGNDEITGGADNDEIDGGSGNDVITGGTGNDVIDGGSGNDVITGGDGVDTISGGSGNDEITGGIGDDVISGGSGNDEIKGDAGNDIIDAGDGNDNIYGGVGTNTLTGGRGTDTYHIADASENTITDSGGTIDLTALGNLAKLNTLDLTDLKTKESLTPFLEHLNLGTQGSAVELDSTGLTLNIGKAGSVTSIRLEGFTVSNARYFSFKLSDGTTDGSYFIRGSAITSVIFSEARTTTANKELPGTDFSDRLVGRDRQVDTLNGGKGGDTLLGLSGGDILNGGAGNDLLIGGADGDSIDGGTGEDTISYATSRAVSLALTADQSGIVGTGGHAEGDTIDNVEKFIGTRYGDTFTLTAADVTKAYTLDGGRGTDTLKLSGTSASAFEIDLAAGTFSFGASTSTISNIELIDISSLTTSTKFGALTGSDGVDKAIIGDGDSTYTNGDDLTIKLGAGNDILYFGNYNIGSGTVLYGGEGFDTADYSARTGTGADFAFASNEFEKVIGSKQDDIFFSNQNANEVHGGLGQDTISYSTSQNFVVVNLGTARQSGSAASQGDILYSIENIVGTGFSDILTGSKAANVITGGAGADTINGGGGIDTVSYAESTARVIVDLQGVVRIGRSTYGYGRGGDAEGDKLLNIENIIGSFNGDTLTGNHLANRLEGGDGGDTLYGGAGNDILTGGDSASSQTDNLHGGAGDDTYLIRSGDGKNNVITDDGGLVRFDFTATGDSKSGNDLVVTSGTDTNTNSDGFTITDYFVGNNKDAYTIEYLSNGDYAAYAVQTT